MRPSPALLLALLLLMPDAATVVAQPTQVEPARAELLVHPNDVGKHVELFWSKPAGDGPWPALILIHGHQEGERPGAKVYVDRGTLERFAAHGLVVAAVSQPGYGRSDGPPDFCGPRSQSALVAAIGHMRKQAFVDPRRIALFGYSRGAVVAAMVASQVKDLAALVLGAGIYDLKETYPRLNRRVQQNIDREVGSSRRAYWIRSPIFHVRRIQAPTLILHGEQDDRASFESATTFAAALKKSGTSVRLVIFPGVDHGIPPAQQASEWLPFLQQHLRIE